MAAAKREGIASVTYQVDVHVFTCSVECVPKLVSSTIHRLCSSTTSKSLSGE